MLTMDDVITITCAYYKVTRTELTQKRGPASLARVRALAFILIREFTHKSFAEIGAKFGGRDHSTIMQVSKRATEAADTDAQRFLNWARVELKKKEDQVHERIGQ